MASIDKNMLETCKNPRPTSGRSELPKSCTMSIMNFHMVYFSWIPQNNARLKLCCCKFGESKCSPYWDITLMTSTPSEIILWYSYSASSSQGSNWNPYWFIALMNSFYNNYILNDNKNLCQLEPFQFYIFVDWSNMHPLHRQGVQKMTTPLSH